MNFFRDESPQNITFVQNIYQDIDESRAPHIEKLYYFFKRIHTFLSDQAKCVSCVGPAHRHSPSAASSCADITPQNGTAMAE